MKESGSVVERSLSILEVVGLFPLSGDADTKYVMTITEEERSALDDEGGIEEKYLNRRFELTFTDGTPDLPPSGYQSPTDQQQSLAGTQVRLCMIHTWILQCFGAVSP